VNRTNVSIATVFLRQTWVWSHAVSIVIILRLTQFCLNKFLNSEHVSLATLSRGFECLCSLTTIWMIKSALLAVAAFSFGTLAVNTTSLVVSTLEQSTAAQCLNHDWPVDKHDIHIEWCLHNGYQVMWVTPLAPLSRGFIECVLIHHWHDPSWKLQVWLHLHR